MLHLISSNGKLTTPSIISQEGPTPSLAKCLRFLRNILQLDAKLSAFESSSASLKLLNQMAETKSYIEFKGAIFIPILQEDKSTWGFIEITPSKDKPTPVQIRKATQAIRDMIEPNITAPIYEPHQSSNFSLLVFSSDIDGGHRMSSNIFHSDKYTSFINLSEWIEQDESFSLKSLREFSDSILFVPELLELTKHQRSILALYSMLPNKLKGSSLIVCSQSSFDDLSEKISLEQNFLSAFEDKKTPLNEYIERRHQF